LLGSLTTETAIWAKAENFYTDRSGGLNNRFPGLKSETAAKDFAMPIDWIPVRVFRVFVVVAVAASSVSAACAQSDQPSDLTSLCANVTPPAPNPVDNVPAYMIPPGASGTEATCQATKALAAGMVAISFDNDVVLADAMGDPGPNLDSDTVSEFPYTAPGSQPMPGLPPPGPSPESPEGFHAYAAFVDPTTGVGYSFSSVGETATDTETDVANWISSTVEPLLQAGASSAPTASAVPNIRAFAAAAPFSGGAGYDPSAWSKIKTFTLAASGNQVQRGTIRGFDRVLGKAGAEIVVYRLNVSRENDDYFLVDTTYTQEPRWDPFSYGLLERGVFGNFWANSRTEFELQARNPLSSTIIPRLVDFAPRTPVTQKTETFTVGASLGVDTSGINGSLDASYSVSVVQDSVQTAVKGTIGADLLRWTDKYNGFRDLFVNPSTLYNAFTGERLAIFKVPRTINDSRPPAGGGYNPGGYPGLLFFPFLNSQVQGYFRDVVSGVEPNEYAEWNTHMTVFVPEPQFSASPLTGVVVSKSLNSVNKPVIIKVVAQLSDGEEKLTWKPQIQNSGLETDALQGETGSGQFAIYPTATAVPSSTTILLNTVPPAAADSVRTGPLKIQVTIVN
jgi:hypothetical protein